MRERGTTVRACVAHLLPIVPPPFVTESVVVRHRGRQPLVYACAGRTDITKLEPLEHQTDNRHGFRTTLQREPDPSQKNGTPGLPIQCGFCLFNPPFSYLSMKPL